MIAVFAAALAKAWRSSRSRDHDLSEDRASAREKPQGPEQGAGGAQGVPWRDRRNTAASFCRKRIYRALRPQLGAIGGFAVCLLLAGCEAPPQGAIRLAVAGGVATLDPRFATDATSARVCRLLYARLAETGPDGRPIPALAGWTRTGPLAWRFRLRSGPGRIFHDGTPLTARDVAATYRAVLNPATGSPHRGGLAFVAAVEAVDDETVVFRLRRPEPLLPAYLGLGILPAARAAVPRPLTGAPVGSGPFRFLGRVGEGGVRLQRRADGQVVEIVQVRDPTVRALKLVRGEVDLLQNDLPPEIVRWLAARPGLRVLRAPGTTYAYMGFNLSDPLTGDLRLRRAVAAAIDREAIARHLFGGAARPAAGLFPPDHWLGLPRTLGPRHDPAAARRLAAALERARGGPVRLEYKTSSDPFRVRVATVIADQLRRAGFEVRVRSLDWGTFYADVKAGRFQLYTLAWVGLATPDIFRYAFHSASAPPAGANRGRYRDRVADRLIEAAEATTDPRARRRLYLALQRRLLETLPYVPLWHEDHVAVLRANVAGYRLRPDGAYDGLVAVRRVPATARRAGTGLLAAGSLAAPWARARSAAERRRVPSARARRREDFPLASRPNPQPGGGPPARRAEAWSWR